MTNDLIPLADESRLDQTDGASFVPRGYFWQSDGEYYTGSEGQWITNLEDLIKTKHHTDRGRLNGCCGIDGCDGLNRVCQSGHEVGTERSDCSMAHSMAFDARLVRLSNGP